MINILNFQWLRVTGICNMAYYQTLRPTNYNNDNFFFFKSHCFIYIILYFFGYLSEWTILNHMITHSAIKIFLPCLYFYINVSILSTSLRNFPSYHCWPFYKHLPYLFHSHVAHGAILKGRKDILLPQKRRELEILISLNRLKHCKNLSESFRIFNQYIFNHWTAWNWMLFFTRSATHSTKSDPLQDWKWHAVGWTGSRTVFRLLFLTGCGKN